MLRDCGGRGLVIWALASLTESGQPLHALPWLRKRVDASNDDGLKGNGRMGLAGAILLVLLFFFEENLLVLWMVRPMACMFFFEKIVAG